ncbi:hypothetical protein ACFYST_01760 [Kitasatospora sp. NPDC004614]|uniref:hypothetical protein n=1 Tax=unclassified Kitasatospora TaxID=2633591 RepID=UPI0036A6585F
MASTLAGRRLLALRAGVLAGAAALPLAAPAVPAFAAPGDNGDVKIHSTGVPFNDPRDESKVCKFYLDAFNFDTVQLISWEIDQQQPAGTRTLSGTIVLAGGTGHTTNLSVPDGSYKLSWSFVGQTGPTKQKTFTVDCASGDPSSPPLNDPASQPGNQQGNQPGDQTGSQQGNQQSGQTGSQHGNQQGGQTDSQQGNQPGNQQGGQTDSQQGNQPGAHPATPPKQQGDMPKHQGDMPKGGIAAGVGGASQDLNPAEIAVGGSLLLGAGWLAARRLRRSRR